MMWVALQFEQNEVKVQGCERSDKASMASCRILSRPYLELQRLCIVV